MPTLTLINLQRYVEHVRECPDPACGFAIDADGTCKVCREHCGHPQPNPVNNVKWDARESDVHNAVENGFLRLGVCPETPSKAKHAKGHCVKCAETVASQAQPREPVEDQDTAMEHEAYRDRLRSATQQHHATQAPTMLSEREEENESQAARPSDQEIEDCQHRDAPATVRSIRFAYLCCRRCLCHTINVCAV